MGESPPGKAGIRLETESNERLRSDLLSSKSEEGILHLLAQRIRTGSEKGVCTLLPCSTLRSAERLQEMLESHGLRPNLSLKPFSAWTPADSSGWQGTLILGNLHRGFSFPKAGLAVIPESELFGEKRPRRRSAIPLQRPRDLGPSASCSWKIMWFMPTTGSESIGVCSSLPWGTKSMIFS